MTAVLDNLNKISGIDPKNMLGAVERLPENMLAQVHSRIQQPLKARTVRFHNIVLMGMGGSASAADVTLEWLRDKISIPAIVHRNPSLPRFAGPKTLFVAVSYSGDTRETLSAFREARKRAASMICIGTGGKLERLSKESSVPFLTVQSAPAPRAALGQMIVACANALHSFGVVQDPTSEIEAAARELRRLNNRIKASTPEAENPAKQFAKSMSHGFPVIFAFQGMAGAARRFKNQLAENSKLTAKYSLLPEAAHNEIEAWHNQSLPLAPIFLRDSTETILERSILKSFRATIANAGGAAAQEVRLKSGNMLGRLLLPILFLDYVSVYLAILKRLDPTDTPWIREYKAHI